MFFFFKRVCDLSALSGGFFKTNILPKKIDWSILAQCDGFAVERLVETQDRSAMRAVQSMRETIFERKIANDVDWRKTFEVLCNAYKDLSPNFSIEHDLFGGYRFMYRGKTVLKPPFVLKRIPVGFVKPVPEGVVTNLSVMSSERTGGLLLLLGPVRFVNSDCNPNAEYNFSSDAGIVQLKLRKRINPGDEIIVKYGSEFFELNSCLCRTCVIERRDEENVSTFFDTLLYSISENLAQSLLAELGKELEAVRPKKRRIRGRELIELYKQMSTAPLEITTSDYIEPEDDCLSVLKSLILVLTKSMMP